MIQSYANKSLCFGEYAFISQLGGCRIYRLWMHNEAFYILFSKIVSSHFLSLFLSFHQVQTVDLIDTVSYQHCLSQFLLVLRAKKGDLTKMRSLTCLLSSISCKLLKWKSHMRKQIWIMILKCLFSFSIIKFRRGIGWNMW